MAKIWTVEEIFKPIPEEVKKKIKPRGLAGIFKGKIHYAEGDIFNLKK